VAGAEEHLRRAVRLAPDNPEPHYLLGDLYERLEQRDEEIREYRIAAAGLDLALNNLGTCSSSKGSRTRRSNSSLRRSFRRAAPLWSLTCVTGSSKSGLGTPRVGAPGRSSPLSGRGPRPRSARGGDPASARTSPDAVERPEFGRRCLAEMDAFFAKARP
jgi:hypothetical protein